MNDDLIQCPCHPVCASLGVEAGQWCRYRKSDLPPPGLHNFNPKDTWCPPGVQANVLLLAHMLEGGTGDPERLKSALERVRGWAQELRTEPVGYHPAGETDSPA